MLEKGLLFMLILAGHDERRISLQINITKGTTSIVQWIKDFSHNHHFFVYYYCFLSFIIELYNISFNWILLILMTRFYKQLLTNNIFHWFFYFVVIFHNIRIFLAVNITNFNNYLIYFMKSQVLLILWSVLKSLLVLCCNQPVYLHCRLLGWFLHDTGVLLGEIFYWILLLFVSFLILLGGLEFLS